MKMKKVLALVLAGIMTASLAACGDSADAPASSDAAADATSSEQADASTDAEAEAPAELSGKLLVWTLADDLKDFGEKFAEVNPGVEVEVVKIEPGEYPTKLETALLGGDDTIDIIVGEPKHLDPFFDAGFFANLDELGAKDYEGQIVDYVWEVGQDDEGIQRAISYQLTPIGFFYRRDIADKVFGFSDPEKVGELMGTYDAIIETARTLKENGYRIFGSTAETSHFKGNSSWVVDGKLNVDPQRYEYMDLAVQLYQEDLTAYAQQWTTPWYKAMNGPITMLTEETQWNYWGTDEEAMANYEAGSEGGETTEVFAYGLPAWGVLTLRDNATDTIGKWGVCTGPAYGYDGGTYIGISEQSQNKELAWEFVKFVTLNEETADWWIEESNGDTVSLVSALEKHAEDENELFGGQQLYKFWLERAEGIDLTKVTGYDTTIEGAWGNAITAIQKNEKTKEEAIEAFYEEVATLLPDLIIEK